jgi:pimeloyl-ACP methyl ester carboxylesterase
MAQSADRVGRMSGMSDDRGNALFGELRAVPEFGAFLATSPVLGLAPRGDGHPVLVLPGLGGDDRSTTLLRGYLRYLGYHVHGWRLGTNQGPNERTTAGLTARLDDVAERHGQPISLVGWSLGGVYARALARRSPRSVRLVVTLGSPIRDSSLSRGALLVPATSIYSRTDGVVPYQYSLEDPGAQRENVEVRGSHLGLGHNPAVLWVVADRLAQPPGQWAPFRPPPMLRRLFPAAPERRTA